MRNGRSVPRASDVLEWARPLEFESVECVGELEIFDSFCVHTDCYTHFRSRGQEYRLQLFKDVLVKHGGYKIFRYYDEDPEVVSTRGQSARVDSNGGDR